MCKGLTGDRVFQTCKPGDCRNLREAESVPVSIPEIPVSIPAATKRLAFYRAQWKKAMVAHVRLNSRGPQGYRMPLTVVEAECAAESMIEETIKTWEESAAHAVPHQRST